MNNFIYDMLPEGEENKVTKLDLMNATGLDERALRAEIRRERLDGALIVSVKHSGGGYYRPGTLQELKTFYKSMRGEGLAIFQAVSNARREIKRLESEEAI